MSLVRNLDDLADYVCLTSDERLEVRRIAKLFRELAGMLEDVRTVGDVKAIDRKLDELAASL